MKKLIVLFLISVSAYAASPSQTLMNAVTVCPEKDNPLKLLSNIEGNSFGEPEFEAGSESVVIVDAISNPQLLNPLIMAPVRILSKFRVSMSYPAPGYGLVCSTSMIAR